MDHTTQRTTWTDPRVLNIDEPPGASLTPGIISTQTSGWSCSVCTFINKPSNDKCDMCGTECARIGRDKIHHNGLNDTLVNEHEDAITEAWQLEPSFVEDESSDGCFKCNTKFTWRNRRHHCKSCGLLFCSNCSSKSLQFIIAFEENFKKDRRVCDSCASVIQESSGSISDSRLQVPLLRLYSILKTKDAMSSVSKIAMQGLHEKFKSNSAMRIIHEIESSFGFSFFTNYILENRDSDASFVACNILFCICNVYIEQRVHIPFNPWCQNAVCLIWYELYCVTLSKT